MQAKVVGAETCGQRRNEKLHAAVAQSPLSSQKVQNTPCSAHFWKFGCRKMAGCCGAKHICKSTCTKQTSFEALLEVPMAKKCMRCGPMHISKC